MPSRSPACEPWSTSVVLSWVPAGRIDELTTVLSFSAELASTNSWVRPSVAVTLPPAASGVRNRTTALPASASWTIRPAIWASKSPAALSRSFRPFFSSVNELIWPCRSFFSSRSPDSSVSDSRPEPSTTPTASARNTAASEMACERRDITRTPLRHPVLYPQQEPVPVRDDPVDDDGVATRNTQRDDDRDQHGQDQHGDRPRRDPVTVERRKGF